MIDYGHLRVMGSPTAAKESCAQGTARPGIQNGRESGLIRVNPAFQIGGCGLRIAESATKDGPLRKGESRGRYHDVKRRKPAPSGTLRDILQTRQTATKRERLSKLCGGWT